MSGRSLFVLLFTLLLAAGCGKTSDKAGGQEQLVIEPGEVVGLVPVWATDNMLNTPESVLFDPEFNRFYVSNVGGESWELDGDGYLTTLSPDGSILEELWATGLSGPKGMGISGGFLYVADIDRLAWYDRRTGERRGVVKVPDGVSAQLNDIAVSSDGTVYVSGSGAEAVYRLVDGKLEKYFGRNSMDIGRPNGLWWQDGQLLMAGSRSGALSRITEKGAMKTIVEGLGAADGIAGIGPGEFLVSDWNGQVFYVRDNEFRLLLDTREEGANAADLAYIPEQRLLLVPTFHDDRIRAYRLNRAVPNGS